MSFSDGKGFHFNENGIATNAPRTSGVYGIFNPQRWLYIGESQDIEGRLYEHLRGESDQSARILRNNPTGFFYEECNAATRMVRESSLIRSLNPLCNQS